MDNYASNSSGGGDDFFGFIPPNMMYPNDNPRDRHGLKEEQDRREYEIDHTDTMHLKN